jgi:hypothetical protein
MVRRVLILLVTALMITVAAMPLVLTVKLGWYETDVLGGPLGPGSDIWIILILFYAVWLPLCTAGLVVLYDRLDVHYMYVERPPRTTRRERRRRGAGSDYLRGQEQSRSGRPPNGAG